ncbi:unnamed protein product [Miscanthus lutarioriparius]|uniref:rRNA adenine N(6)-methyltransferase n=1 Tax=Miscanthus lutarioriparius TaxID=422564 RepID=A0A811NGL9_9POAL|nr:unnamed protein product [Miscanthus lutarioriparius]
MKRAISALWARHAVRQAYLYTTSTAATSSSPEVGASASEAWDGRFRLHKPRGQHLLTNPLIVDAIARRVAISPGDAVLEVGLGTGNLTARLLASHAARVAAVEIDPRMVEAVSSRSAHTPATLGLEDKLMVIAGDAVEVEFPEFDKEFARRLVATPGDGEYNRLAANVRLVADVRLLMDVSKRDFVPMPRVDSSLIEIRPRG